MQYKKLSLLFLFAFATFMIALWSVMVATAKVTAQTATTQPTPTPPLVVSFPFTPSLSLVFTPTLTIPGLDPVRGSSIKDFGVYGQSVEGNGVGGYSTNNSGIYGSSKTKQGVYGDSDSGVGVFGYSHNGANNFGVLGESVDGNGVGGYSTNKFGVYGYSKTNRGIHGKSDNGVGIFGESDNGVGVFGHSHNGSDNFGVQGLSVDGVGVGGYSTNNSGVYGSSKTRWGVRGVSESGVGVYGGSRSGLAGSFDGKVEINGMATVNVLQIRGGSDLAEPFAVAGANEIEAGLVVAIDPAQPGGLRVADKAYDHTVAGILSGANGIQPGVTMQQEDTVADGSHLVALSGRVYCWASATNGPIEPGDLLTTSDTPGYAMKVTDYARAQGAILGKAMSPLKEGSGLILVLVTLQ